MNAMAGDDYIKDQGGTDTYEGGNGFDTVAYDGWFFRPYLVQRGISVDLSLGTVIGPDGSTDTLVGTIWRPRCGSCRAAPPKWSERPPDDNRVAKRRGEPT